MNGDRILRCRCLKSALLAFALAGCGPKLELGSDVLWATDHESGSMADWLDDGGGGLLLGSTITIADGPAHSGRYSLKFSDPAQSDTDGPSIYRELVDPQDAYYSAWYYIPRAYQTNSQWTIQKFLSRSDGDAGAITQGHDLNLRTLPGGQVILYVFSHDSAYLQAPLTEPPALVPVATWFHLETFFSARVDETGTVKVWLDDRLVYDLERRRTTGSSTLLWSPCDIGEDVQPAPPELYVDDAVISRVRVTRQGKVSGKGG